MIRKKNASEKGQTDVLKQTAETDPSTPSKNNGGQPMTNQDIRSKDAVDLRQKAETIVREEAAGTALDSGAPAPEEIHKSLHELRIHQVELEMQNEELRTAQTALGKSKVRYFDFYDLAPVGYLTLSEQGLILEANLAASALLGMKRSALFMQPISRFIHKEDQDIYYLHRKKIFATGEPQECELRLVKPDGALFWAHMTATTAQAEDGAPVCRVVVSDISVRKRAEEKIRVINEHLQKANAEKDMLFTIIAHDLRSPMCGLVASTEMLANEPELFSEKDIHTLSTELHKNAKNTFALLEDLLQWARMSQGGIDFAPEASGLDELMTMGLSTAQDMAKAKDIAIRRDVPQGITVLVDQPMVKTVIRNILFNAVKFTHRGGEIVIKARQEGRTVTVAIQDNGMGMNEQVVSTFFTLNKVKCHLGTEGEKGTGLGLVLCKQFVEQHGGKIWVESSAGQGTTVFFTLQVSD